MRTMVRAFAPLALVFMTLGLAACNTVEGMGRDVSATGRAVSGTADRATPR